MALFPSSSRPARAAWCLALAALAGCASGPDYVRPAVDLPGTYKESAGWTPAQPRAVAGSRDWWRAYGDATLDALVADADRANQDLRQAEARWRAARALVDQTRAGLWPSLSASAGADRARTNSSGPRTADALSLGLAASWEPDLWGALRRGVEGAQAGADASADDLAAARLSLQAALAQDYVQLRSLDEQRALYATTIAAYQRALQLTQAQHAAGVALQSDVALAQSQLATAQATAVDLDAQRAQTEHALAILTGRAPAQFSLPATERGLALQLPAAPPSLPSQLLQSRPDIAAAERRAAAANAGIGVARAAWFPSLALGASGGFSAADAARLFDVPARVWALGATLAQTLFDGGARRARDAQALAAWDLAVAQYRQTVLDGLQQVEDQLALRRLLDQEATLQATAVEAAQRAERLALVQYQAGTTSYLAVVTAQQLSLANQRTAVQLRARQLAASVALVGATGGGWSADAPLPSLALAAPDNASPIAP